jgi:hypothetical protein
MIASWPHHKIKNKTLAQSYKFQTSPSMKILYTNNRKRGLELKVWESQGQCSKPHQRFHQISTAVQVRFNTCLLNNLLVSRFMLKLEYYIEFYIFPSQNFGF